MSEPLFWKVKILWAAIVDPVKFQNLEEEDSTRRYGETNHSNESRIVSIRRGQIRALCLSIGTALAGSVVGVIVDFFIGSSPISSLVPTIFGTMVLLWATLALQGWNIQSMDGITLGERVNRWIFRIQYCTGTFFVSVGATWSLQLIS